MKTLSIILICLISAVVLYLYFLGIKSQSGHTAGLENGKLTRCPTTPNCVNSEFNDQAKHYIAPISYSDNDNPGTSPLIKLKDIILQLGGTIQSEEKNYLSATFTSRIFNFVDDVEARLDDKHQVIHLRSASRVGRSDLGVNKSRIESIKMQFEKVKK